MGLPQPRQHRLGDRELPDHVDFQLLSPLIGTDRLHRTADADARVVDDRVEPLRQRLVQRRDVVGRGDVEDDRGDALRVERGHGVGVLLAADPGDDVPAACGQMLDDRLADTAGRAGDEY